MRVAELRNLGVQAAELRHAVWTHPYRGVARLRGAGDDDVATRIRDAAALVSDSGALTGWAAAYHQGVRYLDGLDRCGDPQPIAIVSGPGHQLRRRVGIEPSRAPIDAAEILVVDGIAVASLPRALYDQVRLADNLVEAVVVLDMGVSTVTQHARTTLDAVGAYVERAGRARGIRQTRAALELATSRSASPSETRLRMVAVLDLSLDQWLLNAPIFSTSGDLLGVADLLGPQTGLVLEADGSHHDQLEARGSDHRRDDVMHDHNLTVVRITESDFARGRVHHRIGQGVKRAERRDRRRDRWTLDEPPWWTYYPPARRWA